MTKPGYLYVLVHPSDPNLYKVGVTILHPKARLAQHNHQFEKHAGGIVKETGQKWDLKTCIAVPDPYWSEQAFWSATGIADIPYRNGIEVQKMDWASVQAGLDAATKAGIRPLPMRSTPVRNRDWMMEQLKESGLTMIGRYRGLVPDWSSSARRATFLRNHQASSRIASRARVASTGTGCAVKKVVCEQASGPAKTLNDR